jgi:hypothetical protein
MQREAALHRPRRDTCVCRPRNSICSDEDSSKVEYSVLDDFLRCHLEPPTQNVDLQAGSQVLTLKYKPNTDFPWNWLAQAAYRSGGLPKRHSRLL